MHDDLSYPIDPPCRAVLLAILSESCIQPISHQVANLSSISFQRWSWLLFAAMVSVVFSLAAIRPLEDPDEGRYAEIPREMIQSGDWVVPHLNGLIYIEKPPLHYWITALGYQVFGEHPWVVRLASVSLGLAGAALVVFYLMRTAGSVNALAAAAMFASSLLYFVSAQFASLDMTLCFFLTAALTLFAWSQQQRGKQAARWKMIGCWIAIAGAIMTKGLIGFVIPAATLCIYSMASRDGAIWRHLQLRAGMLALLVLCTPWFVLMAYRVPGFNQFFFVHEHLARFATDEAQRLQPWWYFVVILAAGMAPWTPSLVRACVERVRNTPAVRKDFDTDLLMLVWSGFILVFFSVSHSKLPGYILPVVPALVIFIARNPRSLRGAGGDTELITAAAGVLLVSLALALAGSPAMVPKLASLAESERWTLLAAVFGSGLLLLAAAMCSHTLETIKGIDTQRLLPSRLLLIAAGWFSGATLIFSTLGAAAPAYSGELIASKILGDPAHGTGTVYQVDDYDQTLPFYLQRLCVLVRYRGEFDFGLARDSSRWIADLTAFDTRWRQDSQAIAVMPPQLYAQLAALNLPMRFIAADAHHIAVARR